MISEKRRLSIPGAEPLGSFSAASNSSRENGASKSEKTVGENRGTCLFSKWSSHTKESLERLFVGTGTLSGQ